MLSIRSNSLATAVVLVAVLLAGCAGSDAATSSETSAKTPQSAPTATPPPVAGTAPTGSTTPQPQTSSEPSAESETTSPTTVAEPLAEEPQAHVPFSELVKWLPSSAFALGPVEYVNFVRAAEVSDVRHVGCTNGNEAFRSSLGQLGELGAAVRPPSAWGGPDPNIWDDPADFESSFGIPLCRVQSWLEWRAQSGPVTHYVASTPVESVQEAVDADPVWSPLVEQRTSDDGAGYWFWGDGIDVTFTRQSPARPLGEMGTLGLLSPDLYLRAPDETSHLSSLQAGQGVDGTLAEEGFAEMAAYLDGLNAYRYQLTRGVVSWNGNRTVDKVDPISDRPHLQPYLWVGVGLTLDDQGQEVTTLVLSHSNAELASDNASALADFIATGVPAVHIAERWSDQIDVERIEAIGNLTVLTTIRHFPILLAIERRDNLLWAPDAG